MYTISSKDTLHFGFSAKKISIKSNKNYNENSVDSCFDE